MANNTPSFGKGPRQLHLQIADDLRQKIASSVYSSGEPLPSEIELTSQFGVSRGTVRQAMKMLVDEGLLERIPGKGTFIRSPDKAIAYQAQPQLVGIVVPFLRDLLSTEMMHGVERVLRSSGYNLIFCHTDRNLQVEFEQIEQLKKQRVRGIIWFPIAVPEELEILKNLSASGIPIILIDRQVPGSSAKVVMADNFGGAYEGVKHLLELDHRRIVCITHPSMSNSVSERIRGYEQAMRDAGLLPFAAISLLGKGSQVTDSAPPFYSPEEMSPVDHMLNIAERPTAVFCINDFLAIGVMRYVLAQGLRVPEDIAIVGFDNSAFAPLAPVPLTTVAQLPLEIGEKATEVLLAEIAGEPVPEGKIILPTRLVVRQSSGGNIRFLSSLTT